MARLRKVRLIRVTTPVAKELVQRLSHEPERIEQNTGGMDVIRSSTPLPATLVSDMDTLEMQTITPDEWLLLQTETHPEQLKWML